MNHFIALFVAFFAISLPAHAALNYSPEYYPTTGPGGLSTPYPAGTPEVYAGMLEVPDGNSTILVFADSFTDRVSVGDFWMGTVYTYADVMAPGGAPVQFTPAQYARAGWLLNEFLTGSLIGPQITDYGSLRGWAEANGNNVLAWFNASIWTIMSTTDCPPTVFGSCGHVDTFDWSNTMVVISPTGITGDEWLAPIMGQTVSGVPEPKAFWLLASGLLVVGHVARRKSLQEARIK